MMIQSESHFILLAAKNYDNPACTDMKEFYDDLKRVSYVKKILSKYSNTGEMKTALLVNHIIILYNCFGSFATQILFWRLAEYSHYIVPVLQYLSRLPEYIQVDGGLIESSRIIVDEGIPELLKGL